MRAARRLVVATALTISWLSLGIASESDGVRRLHVGITGINCYKDPCPRMGIFPADSRPETRKRDLLYAGTDRTSELPRIEASEANRRALEAAWRARQCIAVDGAFVPGTEDSAPVLRVVRIVGAC